MGDSLILVDGNDREIGYAGKETCHSGPGILHRAFSVVVLSGPTMLITQRSALKRTWPLYWSNACCSHPRPGESCAAAATRRLEEELGIRCELEFLYKFRYEADYDGAVGENELDWVFEGEYSGPVRPNPEEIADYRFVDRTQLARDMQASPERYTPWFRTIVLEHRRRPEGRPWR
jgi:isopentenyl-diphosphate delta-isomerase